LPHPKARIGRPLHNRRHLGQSTAEFALLVPVMLLLVLAIADFGRLYTSAVAVESAGREAADFGSFDASYWTSSPSPGNYVTTVAEMERRACTAAAGSHLEGYQTTDPVNNATCTNPTFTCTLERNGATADCLGSTGFTNGVDCSNPSTEPPCTVHVQMTYQFQTFLVIPPLPSSISIVRDSYFRISNLQPAPSP
jgi:Flp pilus assembly protein TadG